MRDTRILFQHSASARAWMRLIASTASLFSCSRISVIDQQEEEDLVAWGRRLDGPADITVYKLQRLINAVGYPRRKGGAPLFADEAPVAQLVHAFDCRQTVHHLLLL